MNKEAPARTEDSKLKVTNSVDGLGESISHSGEEMDVALTAPVGGGSHGLATVPLREETLPAIRFEDYSTLLADVRTLAEVKLSLALGRHIDDATIEQYCFDRLSLSECGCLEDHLKLCSECATRLQHRWKFITRIRAALKTVDVTREVSTEHGDKPAIEARHATSGASD